MILSGLLGVRSAAPAAEHAAVRSHVLYLVDPSRTIRLSNGHKIDRPITTYVTSPAAGRGPWPLIVFGHGYAATPAIYRRLLRAWALAGYLVAAPVFPLGNANAPGGPDERDILNQPGDMSFVITQLLQRVASNAAQFHGSIDPAKIAVAGQSDGGATALAVTFGKGFSDKRIRAAVILSGSKLPGLRYRFAQSRLPLLATQGTADVINPPQDSSAFYRAARRPKFLLLMHGAGHIGPYTTQEPQLGIVERVTTAFLDRYLKNGPLSALERAGRSSGTATLTAAP